MTAEQPRRAELDPPAWWAELDPPAVIDGDHTVWSTPDGWRWCSSGVWRDSILLESAYGPCVPLFPQGDPRGLTDEQREALDGLREWARSDQFAAVVAADVIDAFFPVENGGEA